MVNQMDRSSERPPRAVAVEPALRARRIEVQRAQGRRRLRNLIIGSVVLLSALIGWAASQSPLFDVDQIEVAGISYLSPEVVAAASGVEIGQPLHSVNTGLVAERVAAMPWVRDVTVERHWGGSISIAIDERIPRLILPTATGEQIIIDETGRQVERIEGPHAAPEIAGALPVIDLWVSGELGQPAPPEALAVIRVLDALTEPIRASVATITVDGPWFYLDLIDGGRVLLGDDSSVDEKMVSVETVLLRVDLRCLHEIDVRVPTAPAVTRATADGQPSAAITDFSACQE